MTCTLTRARARRDAHAQRTRITHRPRPETRRGRRRGVALLRAPTDTRVTQGWEVTAARWGRQGSDSALSAEQTLTEGGRESERARATKRASEGRRAPVWYDRRTSRCCARMPPSLSMWARCRNAFTSSASSAASAPPCRTPRPALAKGRWRARPRLSRAAHLPVAVADTQRQQRQQKGRGGQRAPSHATCPRHRATRL